MKNEKTPTTEISKSTKGVIVNNRTEKVVANSSPPIQLNAEDFLLKELAEWICFTGEWGHRHTFEDRDAAAVTKVKEPAQLINYILPSPDFLSTETAVKHENTVFFLFGSLSQEIVVEETIRDKTKEENFSSHHQLVLWNMFKAVNRSLDKFLHYLYAYSKGSIIPTDDKAQAALSLLKHIIEKLEKQTNFQIPDLVNFDTNSVIMSHNEKFMLEHMANQKDNKFTYLFSRRTSENFRNAIIDLLKRKVAAHLNVNSETFSTKSKVKNILPVDHKQKLQIFIDAFGLKNDRIKGSQKYKTADIILLFQMLVEGDFFQGDFSRQQVAAVISSLTGISINTVYNDIPTGWEIDYAKQFHTPGSDFRKAEALKVCQGLEKIAADMRTKIAEGS